MPLALSAPTAEAHPSSAPWPEGHEPTPFQRDVIEAVLRVKSGELATYGEIAEEVGRPGGGQAVSNVLRGVPELPWWRIVPSSGRLYRTHAPTQVPLLEAEGHRFEDRRIVW